MIKIFTYKLNAYNLHWGQCYKMFPVLSHSTVDTNLFLAVRTVMDDILERIHTEWDQTAPKPSPVKENLQKIPFIKKRTYASVGNAYPTIHLWCTLILRRCCIILNIDLLTKILNSGASLLCPLGRGIHTNSQNWSPTSFQKAGQLKNQGRFPC